MQQTLGKQPNHYLELSLNAQKNHFDLLEKPSQVHHFHYSHHFHGNQVQEDFEEVFLADLAPNWSNLSVCTQEDRNLETFLLDGDYFGESVDHFFNDPFGNENAQEKQDGLSASIIQNQENKLQSSPIPENSIAALTGKEDESQNSHDQTKNIPKNYIKAIFSFILQNQEYIGKLTSQLSSSQARLVDFIKEEKKIKKYTIQRLKSLWTHIQNGKLMRIISAEFLRKRCLGYIFGSKIERKMAHVRHRMRFMEGIEKPFEFSNIK